MGAVLICCHHKVHLSNDMSHMLKYMSCCFSITLIDSLSLPCYQTLASPQELKAAIRPDTALVSVMSVNNEIGACDKMVIMQAD